MLLRKVYEIWELNYAIKYQIKLGKWKKLGNLKES
jgi:hypothetical protein